MLMLVNAFLIHLQMTYFIFSGHICVFIFPFLGFFLNLCVFSFIPKIIDAP